MISQCKVEYSLISVPLSNSDLGVLQVMMSRCPTQVQFLLAHQPTVIIAALLIVAVQVQSLVQPVSTIISFSANVSPSTPTGNRLATLEQQSAERTREIEALGVQVECINRDQPKLKDDLNGQMDAIKTNVDGIKTDVDGIKTDIDSIKTRIDGIMTDVDSIKADIDGMKNSQSRIEAMLEGIYFAMHVLRSYN